MEPYFFFEEFLPVFERTEKSDASGAAS